MDAILQQEEPFYIVKKLTRDPDAYRTYETESTTPFNLLPDTIQIIVIGDTVASISRFIPFDQSIFDKFQSELSLKYGTGADSGSATVLKTTSLKARVALFGRSGKEVNPKSSVGGAGFPWLNNDCFPTINLFDVSFPGSNIHDRRIAVFSDTVRHCASEVKYALLPSDGGVPAMAYVQVSSRAIAQDAAMKTVFFSALDEVLSATYDAMLEAQNAEATEAASPDL